MVSKLQHTVSAFKSASWLIDFSVKSPPTFTEISKEVLLLTISVALTACLPL